MKMCPKKTLILMVLAFLVCATQGRRGRGKVPKSVEKTEEVKEESRVGKCKFVFWV